MIIATDISQEIKTTVTNDDRENLLQLLYKCPFEPRQEKWLSWQINNCDDVDEYKAIRKNLLMNRIEEKDRIAMGYTYNMSDINACIRFMNKTARKIHLIKI